MTNREPLESVASCVWRGLEEDDDDFEYDRITLLGILGEVRAVLHEMNIEYEA